MPVPAAPDPAWFALLAPWQQVLLQFGFLAIVLVGMLINYLRKPATAPPTTTNDVVLPGLSVADMRPWRETSEASKAILTEQHRQTEILVEIRDVLIKQTTAEEIERQAIVRAAAIVQGQRRS